MIMLIELFFENIFASIIYVDEKIFSEAKKVEMKTGQIKGMIKLSTVFNAGIDFRQKMSSRPVFSAIEMQMTLFSDKNCPICTYKSVKKNLINK